MDTLNSLWIHLSTFEKTLWGLAIPFTVFFILQTLSTVFGFLDDDNLDSTESELLSDVFTIRNIVSFFLGFSWGALAFIKPESGILLPTISGMIIGLLMVAVNMLLLKIFAALQSSGSLNLNKALGQHATVTVQISPNNSNYGKVRVSIRGRSVEIEAFTKDKTAISEGASVTIDKILGSQFLVSRS
jgi:hypothetical protein